MANRTVKDAQSIKGTNPQFLIEKIIRTRIYDSQYWKEKCFALTAELLVDEAMALDFVGGVIGGNVKPTPFICLILKMLQIQPSKDIIIEFIKNPDYKYVRALGALYLRIVGTSVECYKYLEPLYNDYRKIKYKNREGKFELSHVDEFVDRLLREDRVCDVILPRLQKRHILEETEQLEPRISALDDDLEADISEEEEEEEEEEQEKPKRSLTPERRRSVSRSPVRHRRRSHSYSPRRRRSRSHSPAERHKHGKRRRSRSRSPTGRYHRHSRRSPSPTGHHKSSRKRSKSPDRDERKREERARVKKEKHRKEDEREKDKNKDKDRHKEKDEKKKSKKKPIKKEMTEEEELEIKEANELRAKLGLKPLKV